MRTPAPADLQRWSEELARNPASLAFLPLARAYRRLGRRDHAVQLCQRGLKHQPTHVEAHALLALLYFESGDRAKAADEWATVLRLKPGNFEALRGMGFRYLEQSDVAKARQHLERAALIRPDDVTVQEALRLIRQREGALPRAPSVRMPAVVPPGAGAPMRPVPSRLTPATTAAAPSRPQAMEHQRATAVPWTHQAEMSPHPEQLFESLAGTGPLLGVLLLDRRGLVLAGALRQDTEGSSDELGALIGTAIDEAVRTAEHLRIGPWKGLLLECTAALIHVAPVSGDAMVVVAARRGAPAGWVMRSALHAASIAERFMKVHA
jgi:tetratricopeptide (TPR) repeat protein